jgi:hypothetical protein
MFSTILINCMCGPRQTITMMRKTAFLLFYNAISTSQEFGQLSQYSDRLNRRLGFNSQQGQDFSLVYGVYTGAGAHPTSHKRGTRDNFPGGKVAGA